uniref:Uncharacterized protein n=1 Tax=Lepeophtheirus salmonis TaxID=72036 RepID=A0A0K2UAE5_LEPSM
MTLERDRQVSIRALQAVGRLQDHRLRRQQVRNVVEEEGLYQKGQTGSVVVEENTPGQSPQVHEGPCKISRGLTPDCLENSFEFF